jgi:RNA polymerase sigma-70 factor (ECF subfamily)
MTRRPDDLSPVKVRPWLMAILGNLHTDRCRAVRRYQRVAASEGALLGVAQPEAPHDPPWLSIDTVAVEACLERLDPRLREAYSLQVQEGLSLSAIAERLGVPAATAGTRVFRARRRLRELLTRNELQ